MDFINVTRFSIGKNPVKSDRYAAWFGLGYGRSIVLEKHPAAGADDSGHHTLPFLQIRAVLDKIGTIRQRAVLDEKGAVDLHPSEPRSK